MYLWHTYRVCKGETNANLSHLKCTKRTNEYILVTFKVHVKEELTKIVFRKGKMNTLIHDLVFRVLEYFEYLSVSST